MLPELPDARMETRKPIVFSRTKLQKHHTNEFSESWQSNGVASTDNREENFAALPEEKSVTMNL
jgi:hypothetical protein